MLWIVYNGCLPNDYQYAYHNLNSNFRGNSMDIELVGLTATLFIAVSFAFKNTSCIRIGNSIGSILFIVYGLHIGALSVWVLNSICLAINVYRLIESKVKINED